MKKIYILTAVFALLTLSLNAQDGAKDKDRIADSKAPRTTAVTKTVKKSSQPKITVPTMNELLSGIEGMSSILPSSYTDGAASSNDMWRAPMKINADEYIVGPFTGDNVGSTAKGYHSAYPDPQWITVTTELTRDEFINHVGDEIVGFRFALGGNTSRILQVSDFVVLPRTSSDFDNANSHDWKLANITGATIDSYDDIVIETVDGYVGFKSIILYCGSDVVTQWVAADDEATTPANWTWTGGSHFASNNDGSYYMTYGSSSGGGVITIPATMFAGCSGNLTLVINAGTDSGEGGNNHQITVNNNSQTVTNENPTFANFTWTFSPTGTTTPEYLELNGGYTGGNGSGNWHEYYLSEPVEFNVASDVQTLRLGYIVRQYPTSEETYYRFPIGLNPESTSHNHYVYRYGGQSSTETGELTGWYASSGDYSVPSGWSASNSYGSVTAFSDNNDGSMWLSGGGTITIPASILNNNSTVDVIINAAKYSGNNRTLSVNGDSKTLSSTDFSDFTWENVDATNGITITLGDSYVSIMSISIVGQATTTTYTQQWYTVDFSDSGDLTAQLIFRSTVPKTPAPVITADTTATSVIITATGDGTVTLTVGQQTETGSGSASITIPRGNTDQTVTATATAQDGDLAESNPTTEQIGVPALPKTPTPTITYQVVGNNMVITATGQGTVNLSVTGGYSNSGEGTASVTIPLGLEEQTVTATATAQLPNYQESDPATQPITLPEAGRSPQPTITFTDNGDGTYTITVTGTGEVAVYIDDAEHAGAPIATADNSFSFNVEQHSQAMSITVSATNQEEGLAVSRPVTETYPIPAMTIGDDFQELVPQPANASTPIDMKSLMFVDRFSKVIPNENNHPRLYEYTLEETQVRQRSSNSIPVEVKHTGSDGLGFYSLNQIDNDTVRTLKMDVRNAATDIPLEADPKVYYYTVQRSTAAYPDQADRKWLGVLQRTSDGYYYENLTSAYDYGHEPYPGGQHHIHLDNDTIQGEYNQYLTYVPIVWTMGFDRVLYETDHIHNSYGAPKWKTGVGDVYINSVDVELQTNNAAVTWEDNGKTSMYLMTIDATGVMPTVNTMPYEPYMFRVFVESKNGKLRNWRWVPEDTVNHVGSHFEAAPGTTTGPICVWSEYVKDSVNVTFNGDEIRFVKEKAEDYDEDHHWITPGEMNILFAALDDMDTTVDQNNNKWIIEDDLKIYVRFYYIVKGSADDHTPVVHGQRPRGEGDDPAGYGTESPGTPPSPSTGVKEVQYYGEIVSQTFYNVQGMSSDKPFDGINIVVTRYSNGTTRTTKVVR